MSDNQKQNPGNQYKTYRTTGIITDLDSRELKNIFKGAFLGAIIGAIIGVLVCLALGLLNVSTSNTMKIAIMGVCIILCMRLLAMYEVRKQVENQSEHFNRGTFAKPQ